MLQDASFVTLAGCAELIATLLDDSDDSDCEAQADRRSSSILSFSGSPMAVPKKLSFPAQSAEAGDHSSGNHSSDSLLERDSSQRDSLQRESLSVSDSR
jgi:hypothetical protein